MLLVEGACVFGGVHYAETVGFCAFLLWTKINSKKLKSIFLKNLYLKGGNADEDSHTTFK